jgi:hypothetical protein
MLVRQAVNNATVFIEATGNDVDILCVTAVVAAEYRIGYVICNLDEPGSSAVHEERRVGDIL